MSQEVKSLEVSQQSNPTDTTNNSVPTGTNDSAITAEGNFGVTPATSDQDSDTLNDVSDPTADTTSSDEQSDPSLGVIDPIKKQELEEKFQAIINTTRFWANPNRIKRLDDALILPVYDDASMRMFYNSAEDELLAEELMVAIKEKRVPVLPTKEQIMERAELKYHEKYVLEPQRKAEREALKKKK